LKSFRDYLLIGVFFLLGGLISFRALNTVMILLAFIIFIFMILEGWFVSSYVDIFQPGLYYANTRGVNDDGLETMGLFRNALGFAERFSYGIFNTHRLSSIFLEQVSLANFSTVIALYVSAFWSRIQSHERLLYVALIIFIILTNNSRTASILALLIFGGFFIFPRLPKGISILYMPTILLMVTAFFYNGHEIYSLRADTLQGRLEYTLSLLSRIDIQTLIGGNLKEVNNTFDSGYVYVIYSQTLVGLITLWLFASLSVPHTDKSSARLSHGLCLYIFLNLLIGAAVFSIKVSAPLWVTAGFLLKEHINRQSASKAGEDSHE
jgi:hypothetical protein